MSGALEPANLESDRVIVATTEEAARDLREQWSEFRARCGHATPDADPDFLLEIYRELGDGVSPHVVCFADNSGTYALLVGRTDRVQGTAKMAQFNIFAPRLNRLEVVYGGIITDGSSRADAAILSYLESILERSRQVISVHHIDNASHLWVGIARKLIARGRATHRSEPHFVFSAEHSSGPNPKRHSSKTKGNFRRNRAKLWAHFDNQVEVVNFSDPSDCDSFLRQCDQVTKSSYQGALGSGVRNDRRWRAIVGTLSRHSRLRGAVLLAKGAPIAYLLGAVFGRQFTLFATAFDPLHRALSPGQVLLNGTLDDLFAEGINRVDFGFGDAYYKRLHATESLEEVTLNLYGRGTAAGLAFALDWMAARTSIAVRRTIESLGWIPALRRRWRKHLERLGKERKGGSGRS